MSVWEEQVNALINYWRREYPTIWSNLKCHEIILARWTNQSICGQAFKARGCGLFAVNLFRHSKFWTMWYPSELNASRSPFLLYKRGYHTWKLVIHYEFDTQHNWKISYHPPYCSITFKMISPFDAYPAQMTLELHKHDSSFPAQYEASTFELWEISR